MITRPAARRPPNTYGGAEYKLSRVQDGVGGPDTVLQ